ncbi:MAG: hypothetical protein OXE99_03240, partial [Cellvibrionales bacterium]|nr:hypothetical protein [Cellvibrionales bacterium]
VLAPVQLNVEPKLPIRCFYHGGSSHKVEWEFMVRLVAEIQHQYDNIHFEFIGNHELNKKMREYPRVSILHPMSWANYQAHILSRTMDIGLVPLFDTTFNRGRSHTKLLDIHRQGAVGLYSHRCSEVERIQQFNAGVIVRGDGLSDWIEGFDQMMKANRQVLYKGSSDLMTDLYFSSHQSEDETFKSVI